MAEEMAAISPSRLSKCFPMAKDNEKYVEETPAFLKDPSAEPISIKVQPRIIRVTLMSSSHGSIFPFRVKRKVHADIRDKVQVILTIQNFTRLL
ncbi:hypothetical protein TNCV_834811 [Trichonephila clavipes]|nr:hypothetical protein TNCV_834811 [Trichonephila clavipes]